LTFASRARTILDQHFDILIASDASEIAIIKRNEHRLWTKSAARDDAEAAMVLAIQLSEQNFGEGL